MADDKKMKPLSQDAINRIKGLGGSSKQQFGVGKLNKFQGKAQGNNSNMSSKRGMR